MNEHKYMWNHAGTALLISIWSDDSVQKQLQTTLRNQSIWDGVARRMMRKGFRVNGKQCRTRIKNILVRYREVKKTGNFNGSGIDPFYNDVDRVMTARNMQTSADTSSRIVHSTGNWLNYNYSVVFQNSLRTEINGICHSLFRSVGTSRTRIQLSAVQRVY